MLAIGGMKDRPFNPCPTLASAISVALLLASAPALANDTEVTLAAGGLVPRKAVGVALDFESLMISRHRISIAYRFRNPGPRDETAVVAFPLPPLDGGDLANEPMTLPAPQSENFVGFAVSQGRTPVRTRLDLRAMWRGRDITARLAALGLTPSVLPEDVNARLRDLPPARRKALEAEGLIDPQDFYPPLRSVGEHGWAALWALRAQFYWTQQFPAGRPVDLIQTYAPVVGGGYVTFGQTGAEVARSHCADERQRRALRLGAAMRPGKSDGDIAWRERNVRYILTTARNWRGPIGRFRLRIEAERPDELVLTCLPGLRRTGPTTWEFARNSFRPARDLDIDFLVPERP